MENIAFVIGPAGPGRVRLRIRRDSACGGACASCGGCGEAEQRTLLVEADDPLGVKPGDIVRVSSGSGTVLALVMVAYLLPVVLFFLGYALGPAVSLPGWLGGLLGFGLSLAAVLLVDRLVLAKRPVRYTVSGFAGGD